MSSFVILTMYNNSNSSVSVNHEECHKTSIISRALICNEIADHSDVVGVSPVGAAPTTYPYLT